MRIVKENRFKNLVELHKEWTEALLLCLSNVIYIYKTLLYKLSIGERQLFKDADFIFQQDLAPVNTAKVTKSWLNDHGVGVLDWPANSPGLNPRENLWGIVKRKMRNKRPKNADELKATVKETWASIPPQQCHKLINSMPRRIEAVIKAKGAPTKY